jgi:hypothetical protein
VTSADDGGFGGPERTVVSRNVHSSQNFEPRGFRAGTGHVTHRPPRSRAGEGSNSGPSVAARVSVVEEAAACWST